MQAGASSIDASQEQATVPSSQRSFTISTKGKNLFDAQVWAEPTSTAIFYRFIASLREKIKRDVHKTTPTHRFIRMMRDRRKLVRCYTQNIDGLERREGLSTDLELGKGSRQRFTKKSATAPLAPSHTRPVATFDSGCEVVQLHGELDRLRCTLCQQTCWWEEEPESNKEMLLAGAAPLCQSCVVVDQDRRNRGKRSAKVGTLRPNIILYSEEHPSADMLGSIMTHDLTLCSDVLLVLGTSLHVHGLKIMVREFAKSIHARPGGKGKVILVNLSKPSESVWKDVFDYWVAMDCDAWVGAMRKHRPDMFQVQEELSLPTRKAVSLADLSGDKENITANSNTSLLVGKVNRPMVIIPMAEKKKKAPLQARQTKRPSTQPDDIDCFDKAAQATPSHSTSPLQLLTPSITRAVTPSKKRRRTLVEGYNEMNEKPSKRSRLPVKIWTEVGAGA